ncbi:unnamed protein product, partial [Rotaria sp. Silwood2]
NEWCLKHADKICISDLKLIEGTDYLFTLSSPFDDFAHIHYDCRVSAPPPEEGKTLSIAKLLSSSEWENIFNA